MDGPGSTSEPHPARILVSSTRKPISYINLAKRFLQEHGEVQLTALGIAIAPMVTVAEILKNRNLAVEQKLVTGLESMRDDWRTRQKPKMEILLTKSAQFDEIIEAENEAPHPEEGEDEDELDHLGPGAGQQRAAAGGGKQEDEEDGLEDDDIS